MATPTRADASEVNPTKRNSHCGMIRFVDFVVSGMRFLKKKGNVEKKELESQNKKIWGEIWGTTVGVRKPRTQF
jgi:hypothetical protein